MRAARGRVASLATTSSPRRALPRRVPPNTGANDAEKGSPAEAELSGGCWTDLRGVS